MKTRFKTQIIVMLLISFVTLNIDYARISANDEETKVLVTYANKFKKLIQKSMLLVLLMI